jgi:predicted alpha/beta hydrolase family esterase
MTVNVLSRFRVVVVPGLNNSGPQHWQSLWQQQFAQFERVEQDHWDQPDLAAWSARLDQLRARDDRPTLFVAHSFGCLTTVASIARHPFQAAGALLVAPADPVKFGVQDVLPHDQLPCPSIVIASSNDPWMDVDHAGLWARRWNSEFISAGALGHINAESGLGNWAFGLARLQALAEQALAVQEHSHQAA